MNENFEGMRTPLARVRFLGAAKTGTQEAWLLHVTSLALVPLSLYFVWLVLRLIRMDYNGVRATLGHPVPAILVLAFVLTGILHMELGIRSSIVDYIDGRARGWALAANMCFCALMAFACAYSVLRIAFT